MAISFVQTFTPAGVAQGAVVSVAANPTTSFSMVAIMTPSNLDAASPTFSINLLGSLDGINFYSLSGGVIGSVSSLLRKNGTPVRGSFVSDNNAHQPTKYLQIQLTSAITNLPATASDWGVFTSMKVTVYASTGREPMSSVY